MGEFQSSENDERAIPKHRFGTKTRKKAFPTIAGVPVLPEEVALSAVALVRAVDVSALLAAWAGQALVHIWRLKVSPHYCQRLIKEFPSLRVNKDDVIKPIMLSAPRQVMYRKKPTISRPPLYVVHRPALMFPRSGNLYCSRIHEHDTKTNTRSSRFSKTYGRLHRHVHTVEDTYTHAGTRTHAHTPSQFFPLLDK